MLSVPDEVMTFPTPQWIDKLYPAKAGRDHLGVGSVTSDQILPVLSPGINVLTVHPRYHSFYTFLLDEFWKRSRPRTSRAWKAFYRPREFIFSLGVHLESHTLDRPDHAGTGSIVGSSRTSALAGEQREAYRTDEDYIQSPLGGYGLYYRSVIAELGLLYPGGPGFPTLIDVPSEQGKKAADAFREAVKDTVYYREYFDHDVTEVPTDVIREYANVACLCQLRPGAPDRALLRNIYLHGGDTDRAAARRATLRFLFDLACQTDGHPIDQDAYRQLLYFRATEAGAAYTPSTDHEETFISWRLFQAREYFNFALNTLWSHLCEWGYENDGTVHPLPLETWWAYVNRALSINSLAEHFGLPTPGLYHTSPLRSLLEWVETFTQPESTGLAEAFQIDAVLHEHKLYRLPNGGLIYPVELSAMIVLLLFLYARFGDPAFRNDPSWRFALMGADGRLPLDGHSQGRGFFAAVRAFLDTDKTVGEFARWLIDDYIVLQHQLIASQKLPDNTYRFRQEGGALRFFLQDNSVEPRDSRFNALGTTLFELGLCGRLWELDHALTPDGLAVLERGDAE